MAEEKVPTTPVAEQGLEGDKTKIAGKFDNLEQLGEGYLGLQKGFHSLSENVSKLTKIIEAVVTNPGPQYDPYQRGGKQIIDDDHVDPAQFLLDPSKFLQKRDEQLSNRIVSQVVDLVGNMTAVNDFKSQNPDLIKHEKIVQAFMRDQDQRLPVSDRLANAGQAARDYLKSLKVDLNASNPNSHPKGGGYVEAPTSGSFIPGVTQAKGDADDGEQSLVDYVRERSQNMADHFGVAKK